MPIEIQPTQADIWIAQTIARKTNPPTEKLAQALTWGADEKVLCGLAIGWWLLCRRQTARHSRQTSDHLLLTTLAASALPHLMKSVLKQKRPDRVMLEGHLNGVPFSGKADDAFPSGHALHIGALASAAEVLPAAQRAAFRAVGAGLVLTRIVLLAHWASDVAAGLIIGAALERLLRPLTGLGKPLRRKC